MDFSKKALAPVRLDADLPDLKLTIDDGTRKEKEDAIRLLRRRPIGLGTRRRCCSSTFLPTS